MTVFDLEDIIMVTRYCFHYLSEEKEMEAVLMFISELTDYSVDTLLEMIYPEGDE